MSGPAHHNSLDEDHSSARAGVLLVNLGTPDSTSVADVRRYLREFLSDPRVIDIHPVARWLLLNLVILPRRPARSAHAYEQIWTQDGSPLLVHTERLARRLGQALGSSVSVKVAMRYGNPSIRGALDAFAAAGIDDIVVVPLSPQYASATAGSATQAVLERACEGPVVPVLQLVGEFYDAPGYIEALAAQSRPDIDGAEHVLMSFHGLPERQVKAGDRSGRHCLATPGCCDAIGATNRRCYRAQCCATGRALAHRLGLPAGRWTTTFQSRFGKDPWIGPATDEKLIELARAGVRDVAIIAPGFVTDCLETLEELAIRGKADFVAAGGERLRVVPCLNDSGVWTRGLADIIRAAAPRLREP